MSLLWRRGELADLSRCLAFLQGHCAYSSGTLDALTPVWLTLLEDAAVNFAVVEDRTRPQGSTVLAFGATVFVTDAHMARERTGAQPYVTARAIQAESRGCSPILRSRAISAAQDQGGLNLLTLHYAETKDVLSSEERHQVRLAMLNAYIAQHGGYRIKELLQEIWDDDIESPYILGGWGPVRSDYAEFAASRRPGEPRPYLLGLTRKEIDSVPGWAAAHVRVDTSEFRLQPGRAEDADARA